MAANEELDQTPFDSDQEPDESDHENLTWRIDPALSLSDWCIQISYTDEETGETVAKKYHVHKNMLVVGKRKSEYFISLFRNEFSEQETQTSVIHLPEIAAKAFPIVLDYLYSASDNTLDIETHNATALSFLARYFGIYRLRWRTKQFWSQDLNLNFTTCGVYLEHATVLGEEKVLNAALDTCKSHIMDMDASSRLVHVNCPDIWFYLLESTPKDSDGSYHMSSLLSLLFENVEMTAENFHRLTDEAVLPHIHPDATIALLDAERRIVKPSYTHQTSLQTRCIQALARNWDFVSLKNIECMKLQHPSILGDILIQVMTEAKTKKDLYKLELSRFKRVPETAQVYPASNTISSNQLPTLLKSDSQGLMTSQYNARKTRRSYPLFYYQNDGAS